MVRPHRTTGGPRGHGPSAGGPGGHLRAGRGGVLRLRGPGPGRGGASEARGLRVGGRLQHQPAALRPPLHGGPAQGGPGRGAGAGHQPGLRRGRAAGVRQRRDRGRVSGRAAGPSGGATGRALLHRESLCLCRRQRHRTGDAAGGGRTRWAAGDLEHGRGGAHGCGAGALRGHLGDPHLPLGQGRAAAVAAPGHRLGHPLRVLGGRPTIPRTWASTTERDGCGSPSGPSPTCRRSSG